MRKKTETKQTKVAKKTAKKSTLKERVKKVYSKYGEKCKSLNFLISKMKSDFERLDNDRNKFNGSVKRTLNIMLKNGELN